MTSGATEDIAGGGGGGGGPAPEIGGGGGGGAPTPKGLGGAGVPKGGAGGAGGPEGFFVLKVGLRPPKPPTFCEGVTPKGVEATEI